MSLETAALVRKKQDGFYSQVFKSEEDFVKEYKKRDQSSARDFYLQVLCELERSVASGNTTNLTYLNDIVQYIHRVEDQTTLNNFYEDTSNPLQNTNLIILACKYNQPEILKFLLSNDMILILSIHKEYEFMLGDDDETNHNAFYYAIRSGNVELFEKLISLAETFFITPLDTLDETLSKTYEELKLKNVPLTDKMEFSVENKLLNLRLFSDNITQQQNITSRLDNIQKRIDLLIENMNSLAIHSDSNVDEIFLFNVKFIAQNIHVLKGQLRFTYDRLPWEEMEFCLICFVSLHTKQQEINLFYHATLNKRKIQQYFKIFAKKLEEVKEVIKNENMYEPTSVPILNRETVVAEITKNNPQFDEMYKNYQEIRDIYSLEKIGSYINLASTVNPGDREGQLVITRVLQIIGEHLKNTLESPNLSSITSDRLLLKFSKNTRKVLTDLRNLLSHSFSLFKRIEIEENSDIKFYIGVQSDLKKVGETIIDILYDSKIEMIKILLNKIIDCENIDDISEVVKALKNVEIDNTVSHDFRMLKHEMFGKTETFRALENIQTHEMVSVNFRTTEHEKLQKIVNEFKSHITDMTDHEEALFSKIDEIIDFANSKFGNIRNDYLSRFYFLKHLQCSLNGINNVDDNIVREMKYAAEETLKNISSQTKPHALKEISELSLEIFHSVRSRSGKENVDDKLNILFEIFCISKFQKGNNIKWIEEFRGRLNKKSSVSIRNQSNDEVRKHLELKLCELKEFFTNNLINPGKIYCYKDCKKLQTVIEMLLLDIMSILNVSKCFIEDDLLSFDGNYPLLIGKCLRNHLAHDNALFDILLSNPSTAILLNAAKFIETDIIKFLDELQQGKKKIGKMIIDNPLKLKKKHEEDLEIIENQITLYASLEKGNLELVQECIKKGADINARSINSWTALHHAAKGPSLEVLKFILESNIQIDEEDQNGQNALHIAVTHGNANIIEYLIETAGLHVNKEDKNLKTPLHIAAQNGHEDIVKVLLKFNADNTAIDANGVSPLYYAMKNNHLHIAKILLKTIISIDINCMGSCMPLHEAAELGHLEIVNFLLQNRADVNAKNDVNMTPLHAAAFMGHLEIIQALIIEGADVNAAVLNGCTPLHYALVNGHEEIAKLLLCHGAKVNISDKILKYTSLHYAAEYGYETIVKTLLEHKASATVATIEGATPLHLAARNGHLGIIMDLLKQNVDIDTRDIHNATPLHYATSNGQDKAVELLIKEKATINVKDNKHFTPLYVAVVKGYKDVVNLLINKTNANESNIEGNTILHAAASNGYKDVVEILIKYKAQINAMNNRGFTPLHLASEKGYEDVVLLLLKEKANVNTVNSDGLTPLHASIIGSHKSILEMLIENHAKINARTISGETSLHLAIKASNKEIAMILMLNGVDVNDICGDYYTLMLTAVEYHHTEIVKLLLDKGAVSYDSIDHSLLLAVVADYKDIVEILIKNKRRVDIVYDDDFTLLHYAAEKGHIDIVKILKEMGADLNAKIMIDNVRPLHYAVQHDHEEVAEYLILNGAEINAKTNKGIAAIHIAAVSGHSSVMKVLLNNKADVTLTDYKNRSPLELAVENDHLQVTKLLLQNKKIDINAQYNEGQTLLHIAAQGNNLNLVRYLISEGANIKQTDVEDSMAIHFAAMGGVKDTVEYLLSNGCSINDLGAFDQTLLHYAIWRNTLEIATYLIDKGADVNAKDKDGLTPIHIAANFGCMDGIELLLRNGAAYDISDNLGRKPWHLENSETTKNAIEYLKSTSNFFNAVKRNNISDIKKYIEAGILVDVKNSDDVTPLFFAAWKGHEEVVSILLQSNANPNLVNNEGIAPLHYASKYCHLKVVKALLSYGAVFDAVSNKENTPLDFSTDKDILNLLELIRDSFISVRNGSARVIRDLNQIKDIDTMKAIMNACNINGETLIAAAIRCDFQNVEHLTCIFQDDASDSVNRALKLIEYGNCKNALCILNRVYEKRKFILGPNNPGTLEIEGHIAITLYELGSYKQALDKLERIYQKQKKTLGLKSKETFKTRSALALLLYRQDRNEEALEIFQEVYQMQKEIIGPNRPEVLDTQFHMSLVLAGLGRHEEALKLKIKH